ncbi:MAG TPA: ATP synthase F1 subunit delta [Terriglobales bacterium]|nr:ATP synthase F1 subunit delta [Terriglobales bacterium]
MKDRTLVRKYAQGLVQAVKDEAEFTAVLGDIRTFLALRAGHAGLREALASPFIEKERRERILRNVLAESGAGGKTVRFLGLLLEHGRLDLLDDIAAALPETWSDARGVLTFEVTSVIPLTDAQQGRLRATLEAAEGKPVSLVFRLDPAIVGGLALRRGHIIYDASVEGGLLRMKERIQQG